jgi:hypothetical protein
MLRERVEALELPLEEQPSESARGALGLTWNDVDLDAGLIRVRRQLDSQTGELRELKTKAAKREIPMPASALVRVA